MLRRLVYAIGLAAALPAVPQLAAQQADPVWKPIATEGVLRASALVDSVYVDRQLRQGAPGVGRQIRDTTADPNHRAVDQYPVPEVGRQRPDAKPGHEVGSEVAAVYRGLSKLTVDVDRVH